MCEETQYKKSGEILASFEAEAVPHMKALFRVAMSLEHDRGKAEHLVEATFMRALQSFHLLEPGASCRAWLVAIMYGVKHRRRGKFSTLYRDMKEGKG
ncbi:MAG TPA: sigma factor [Pyrinomonadaceae bacterium]|nr:sigma factor [Pyrinomonadaceae bacterium]